MRNAPIETNNGIDKLSPGYSLGEYPGLFCVMKGGTFK